MTDLPFDCRKAPIREKYLIDETFLFKFWFIFGEREDGTVDISDGTNDIFCHVRRDQAERIIAARDQFCRILDKELCRQ